METPNVFTIIFVLHTRARDILCFVCAEARAPTSGTVKVYTDKQRAVKLGRGGTLYMYSTRDRRVAK